MIEIKNILCALDLSEHSPLVAEYAASLARLYQARVTVLYVAPELSSYVSFYVPQMPVEMTERMNKEADEIMRQLVEGKFAGIEVRRVIASGYVPDEIMKQLESLRADMVVMGTNGRRGLNRLLLGSVAESIVKTSTVPVLIIKPPAPEPEAARETAQ
jgi:nucleotide-binding universal stress UspA family protein